MSEEYNEYPELSGKLALEEGEYDSLIVDIKDHVKQSNGNRSKKVTLTCDGVMITDYLPLSKAGQFKLVNFFMGLGDLQKGQTKFVPDWNNVKGRTIRAKVVFDAQWDNNKIDSYIPRDTPF